ncbi:helix-turn-helix domain-containing protein [Cnuibacter physcomitrellae]|uniref:helix-turn-helix domain-containing protein n=1 Tax=Cnuibacter physcomitrellae TaxID=1619308 RepID=UPI0021757328|nr:helix-turn-helix transcriptional regulator [Cnuibacter physcomitrellae]MCS5498121.1 helix-turn-helix domain-containing protein [Cnuibacter physcomitrellae]
MAEDVRATEPEPLWRHLVGDRMRTLRHERGETLGEVARRAGVSPQYLSEMERGSKDPSSEMIAAVAGALGWSLLDLTRSVAEQLAPAAAALPAAPAAPAAPAVREPARVQSAFALAA